MSARWNLTTIWLLITPHLLHAVEKETPKTAPADLPPPASAPVDFLKDVLPILETRCFNCHGPKKQESGLRLDLKEAAHHGGDSGVAFDSGGSESSLLIRYVSGVDPDLKMPPEGERLNPQEIGILRRWIDDGASYPEGFGADKNSGQTHWSFLKVSRPEPPSLDHQSEWCRNPIDQFILKKLHHEQLTPSPEADRTTLIRRLNLDLLGFPPTPERVHQFLADSRPDAYEILVEELLSSPHFGERWGRHWLDLARYADSDGYEKDRIRPHAWRYRDWVIQSINRDQPFDQFTIEQLAGDLLPNVTLEQKIATGFHRNTLTNTEGGVDQEEFRVAATVDRVNTLGGVWMGLTLGCAQCHSHKYDPISQREYYQLFAYFNSLEEVNIPAPTPEESAAYSEAKPRFDTTTGTLKGLLSKYETEELAARQEAWEPTALQGTPLWILQTPVEIRSSQGALFRSQPDSSILVEGTEPEQDDYTIILQTRMPEITGVRIETIPDPSLTAKKSARGVSQEYIVSEVSVSVGSDDRKLRDQFTSVPIQNATADFSAGSVEKNNLQSPEFSIDGKPETGWSTTPQNDKPHSLVLGFANNIAIPGGSRVVVKVSQLAGAKKTIGRFRISLTGSPGKVIYQSMPDLTAWALATPLDRRTSRERTSIREYFQTVDPEYLKHKGALDEHLKQEPVLTKTQAQVVQERAERRKTQILTRGDFLRPATEVQEGVPAVLGTLTAQSPPQPNAKHPRLALAEWVVHPDHPLTTRVAINRWWTDLFGQPLVPTVEDFGTRGDAPTHPELLDWLASELVRVGWSRKQIVRLIVTSATYRQESKHRPDLDERDIKNHWLGRQNRFRVEAEEIRDLYLAASGLLNPQIGGPSIRPPLPSGVAELGYAGGVQWPVTEGPDKYRRGLYIFFQRTVPYPMLSTFDAPDSTTTCLRRERSNTPLQALTLLNDPVFIECSQALGVNAARKYPDDLTSRIVWMFQVCLSRVPASEERERLLNLYQQMRPLLDQQSKESIEHIVGQQHLQKENSVALPSADLAAGVLVARVILNLEEFMVRE